MTEQDRKAFATLMFQLNELCVNPKNLSKQFIDFYFLALKDLSIDQIHKNAMIYFRENTNFFPSIKDLSSPELDKTVEASYLWVRVLAWAELYNSPEIGKDSRTLKEKMEKDGEAYIFPLLTQWYADIVSQPSGVVFKRFVDCHRGLTEVNKYIDKTGRLPFRQIGGAMLEATKAMPENFKRQLSETLNKKGEEKNNG